MLLLDSIWTTIRLTKSCFIIKNCLIYKESKTNILQITINKMK